jgi:hypothetical protein
MKTNLTTTALMKVLDTDQNSASKLFNNSFLPKKIRRALQVIYNHAGKRLVFETYSKVNPEMAKKYVKFISENPWAVYIQWDDEKKRFVA